MAEADSQFETIRYLDLEGGLGTYPSGEDQEEIGAGVGFAMRAAFGRAVSR